jgi:hypothetical protein
MKLALLALLTSACLCAQQASLNGVTVDAVTGKPLAGVHVSLVSMGVDSNVPGPDDAYGAISNPEGHYSIGNIRPGKFLLRAQHNGYVYISEKDSAAPPTITLNPGERNADFKIPMAPEATITGRVTDEFGDPIEDVSVRAIAVPYRQPYNISHLRDDTDERGEYRLTGPPGRYYIEVSGSSLNQQDGIPEIRTDGSFIAPIATTYYPGALATERAKAVEVAAGQELTGIDVHVGHRRSVKISGTVTGIPPGKLPDATVTIRLKHEGSYASDITGVNVDGTFAFTDLAPSEYHLQARIPLPGGDALFSPIVKVTVENDDATVTLPLTDGERITGTVRVDGGSPGPNWVVRLAPVDYDGTAPKGAEVEPDGSFAFERIIPGEYRLQIDPLQGDDYVKSVRLGGTEMLDRDLDLTNTANRTLQVTIDPNGGEISGAVTDKEGNRSPARGLIVLAADPNSFSTWRSTPTANAQFSLRGIRPGKYKLFAVDSFQFGNLTSLDPLKGIAARAQEIEIKQGDRLTHNLAFAEKDNSGAK